MDWDALAARYDSQLWLERRPLRAALRLARLDPDDRLLDAGTGTGAVLKTVARRADRPRRATGVDASAAMLAQVGPLPPEWQVGVADIASLPFDAASFDVAIASYVLHILDASAREPAVREINRVLRPGGILVTITPTLPLPAGTRVHRRVAGWLEGQSGPWRGMLPLDPRGLLASAGFGVEATRRVWLGYPSLCVRARRR